VIQLGFFPMRVRVLLLRRIASLAGLVRWRWECLAGVVLRQWRDLAQIQFAGRKRDGSARGCIVLVPTVLPSVWTSPAETLRSAMVSPRGRRG